MFCIMGTSDPLEIFVQPARGYDWATLLIKTSDGNSVALDCLKAPSLRQLAAACSGAADRIESLQVKRAARQGQRSL